MYSRELGGSCSRVRINSRPGPPSIVSRAGIKTEGGCLRPDWENRTLTPNRHGRWARPAPPSQPAAHQPSTVTPCDRWIGQRGTSPPKTSGWERHEVDLRGRHGQRATVTSYPGERRYSSGRWGCRNEFRVALQSSRAKILFRPGKDARDVASRLRSDDDFHFLTRRSSQPSS